MKMIETERMNTSDIALRVKFPPAFGVRLRLSSLLVRLAGRVLGAKVEFVDPAECKPPAIPPSFVDAVTLGPGDRLVIHVDGRLTDQAAECFRGALARWAPDVPVLVLDRAAKLSVVHPIDLQGEAGSVGVDQAGSPVV